MYTDIKAKSGNRDLKESKNSYAGDLLYEQYGYLLEMFYIDLQKQENYAPAIMTEIFVRTGLMLADFIYKAISHIEEDKALPNILSFKI